MLCHGAGDAGVVGVVEGLPSVPRNDDDIHIVFSTDCGGYQHWQSMLTSYSAARVGQKGRVTRIASGCTDKEVSISKVLWCTLMSSVFSVHHCHL
jgi:hypothetical protein